MKINPEIFKAYDIRGVYPGQFNEEIAYLTARAFAQVMKPKLTVLGRDMRTSSPSLEIAVCRGLNDQGSDVVRIGLTSTPMYYYAVNHYNGDIGITVTASHNPPQYNGLKLTGPKAIPNIDYVSNEELYRIASEGKFDEPERKGKIRQTVSPIEDYVIAVKKTSGLTDFGGLTIVVDAGNGMDGIILPTIFRDENAKVIPLFWKLDGTFPNHQANPLLEETLADLKKTINQEKADLGVAYDGDSDRVGFVDETGVHIRGDIVTGIIAQEILKSKPGALIMVDVRTGRAVREQIEQAGGKVIVWKVGHAFMKKKMREIGAVFGGELSCHYYFSDFFVTDNGDLAMLSMIKAILSRGKPLSELAKPFGGWYHSEEINSSVSDADAVVERVREHFSDGSVSTLDGLTVDYPDWWFNLRQSQTEPLVRLNVEARTPEMLQEKTEQLLGIIREQSGVAGRINRMDRIEG